MSRHRKPGVTVRESAASKKIRREVVARLAGLHTKDGCDRATDGQIERWETTGSMHLDYFGGLSETIYNVRCPSCDVETSIP